jgi:transposase-like protein
MGERRYISAEKKVEILRETLDNRMAISDAAEKYGVHPNMITKWKKQLFEGALGTFTRTSDKNQKRLGDRIDRLELTLQKRDRLVAELASENIDLKKNLDGDD